MTPAEIRGRVRNQRGLVELRGVLDGVDAIVGGVVAGYVPDNRNLGDLVNGLIDRASDKQVSKKSVAVVAPEAARTALEAIDGLLGDAFAGYAPRELPAVLNSLLAVLRPSCTRVSRGRRA